MGAEPEPPLPLDDPPPLEGASITGAGFSITGAGSGATAGGVYGATAGGVYGATAGGVYFGSTCVTGGSVTIDDGGEN
jgi:hypothetical protein